jgi:molecular chaperone DnaJ
VPGQGMPGPGNAPAGDLYVDVDLEKDANFERDGNDLITRQFLTFGEATLGTEKQLTLPDDSVVTYSIPSGTQPGTVVSLRDKGVPVINRRDSRGALHVVISVKVPQKLNRKAKKLLEELEAELASGQSG